ncbi:XdhC family protein [Psychrobacter frigidicola]|uniref:XdhC family protein n=1 Tax=Psychrobacter frigidicola TaxID=45611 RepID=A0A5C7A7E4_9GAMM|nr:XdhC/CoxI family protein [Psychrobacter frigidicola]TXD98464.1 XdhC family protein [Psychrobacter frigidicola]
MNQVADILKLAMQAEQQNIDAVLATVVRTEGSAYRQAGAMMLICADGRSVGMISGGCLEPHIIKRAFWLTRHGATVQTYQTGEDIEYSENGEAEAAVNNKDKPLYDDLKSDLYDYSDDDLDEELNFGLGCNGRVHVLFERLATAMPLLDLIRQVRSTQQPLTIATLIKSNSYKFQTAHSKGSQLQIGTRINLDAYLNTGQLITIDSNQNFSDPTHIVINVLKKLAAYKFHKKNAEYVVVESNLEKSYEKAVKQKIEEKTIQTAWLVQRIYPQIRLLICGAGNDVMPLVTMAKLQDWHVTVIDSRPQYATRARFKQADAVLCLPLDDTETLIKTSSNSAVAVMSHSLNQDRARLAVLLEHPPDYLGQLGPRYRTERLIKEISATKSNPADLAIGIAQLHYPIGYKLGGDGPEALALSIMAQMSAVIHGQNS